MSTTDTLTLITSTLSEYGSAILVILGVFLGFGIAYLVFRVGYGWLMDNSYSIGGYYLHNLPYKGYHRFRSRSWNMEHMP